MIRGARETGSTLARADLARLRSRPLRLAASLLLGAQLLAACARSDEDWLARLDAPDPFERALAALALCQQAPLKAGASLPVLLETVDRAELGLATHAAAALRRVAPVVAGELAAELGRAEFMTSDRREAILAALVAAGPHAVEPLVATMRGPGRARAGELGAVLVALGAPAAPALGELVLHSPDHELAAHAAWLLGRLGVRGLAARGALEAAAAGHPAPAVRAAAGAALGELGADAVGPQRER